MMCLNCYSSWKPSASAFTEIMKEEELFVKVKLREKAARTGGL